MLLCCETPRRETYEKIDIGAWLVVSVASMINEANKTGKLRMHSTNRSNKGFVIVEEKDQSMTVPVKLQTRRVSCLLVSRGFLPKNIMIMNPMVVF